MVIFLPLLSPAPPSFFFLSILLLLFFKGNPHVYMLKSKMHKRSVHNSVTHEHLWARVFLGNPCCLQLGAKSALRRKEFSSEWNSWWMGRSAGAQGPRDPLVLISQEHVCSWLHLVLWTAYDFIFSSWAHLKCLTGSSMWTFILPWRKIKLSNLDGQTWFKPIYPEKSRKTPVFILTSVSEGFSDWKPIRPPSVEGTQPSLLGESHREGASMWQVVPSMAECALSCPLWILGQRWTLAIYAF